MVTNPPKYFVMNNEYNVVTQCLTTHTRTFCNANECKQRIVHFHKCKAIVKYALELF